MSTTQQNNNLYESWPNFKEWFRIFSVERGTVRPIDLERWFYRVQKRHQKTRTLLGDKVLKVSIDPRSNILQTHLTVINNIFRDSGKQLPSEIFCHPLQLVVQHNNHPVKITKLISQSAKQLDVEQRKLVQARLSDMGAACSVLKTQKNNSNIQCVLHISTLAEDFAKLGEGILGETQDTCFAQRGVNWYHKYWLGQSHDTVVVYLTRNEVPVARAWGIYNGLLCALTNWYDGYCFGLKEAVGYWFSTTLNNPRDLMMYNAGVPCFGKAIYQNGNTTIFRAARPSSSQNPTNTIKPIRRDLVGIPNSFPCLGCHGLTFRQYGYWCCTCDKRACDW